MAHKRVLTEAVSPRWHGLDNPGVAVGCRAEISTLYRSGIEESKLVVDVSILDLTRHGGDMQCGYICICNENDTHVSCTEYFSSNSHILGMCYICPLAQNSNVQELCIS